MAINPMQAPIDYLGQMGIRPTDPGTALLEGLQLGAVFKQQRQARELEQKNAQFQADMAAWRMNPTDDRIVELMNLYPEFGEGIRAEWKFLDDKLKDAEYTEGMQTLFALRSKTPQVGIDRLDRIIQANEESGQDVSTLKLLRQELGEGSPEEVAAAIPKLQLQLAMLDPTRFEQFSKAQLASEQARVAEGTSEAQITTATNEARIKELEAKYTPRLLRAQLNRDIAAAVASGQTVANAKTEATQKPEADLRAEYWNGTKDYRTVLSSYEKVIGTSDTPAGDQALIYNFMKMLDPNSAVLPGEYATAQNAGSVPTRVWTAYNKVKDGDILVPETREYYKEEARKILQVSEKGEKEVRRGITRIAKGAGLNIENIFYETSPRYLSAPPQGGAGQSQSTGEANTPDLDAAMRQHGGR